MVQATWFLSCWSICKTKEEFSLQLRYLTSNSGSCITIGKAACHLAGGTRWVQLNQV